MLKGTFATVINCMDGRVQLPVANWLKENYHVDYVDVITEPGPDKIISQSQNIDSIKSKVLISVNIHGSSIVVITGHYDCAGNPVSKKEHLEEIKRSTDVVKSWNLPVKIFGLWVNEKWEIDIISEQHS